MRTMIKGIEIKSLIKYVDDRGYFEEIIRASDPFFVGFGQWSLSYMRHGLIKGFHIHQRQYDFWFVSLGIIRAVLCHPDTGEINEFLMGDFHAPIVLKIPPGVAHGLKVLQGPAHLLYITSQEYDGSDEGRIAYDTLGYDWHKEVIK